MIVAYLHSEADRNAARLGAGDRSLLHFCSNADEVLVALRDSFVSAVVLNLHGDSAPSLNVIVQAMSRKSIPVPLLLHFELRKSVLARVLENQPKVVDLRVALHGVDSLSQCVAQLFTPMEEKASRLAIIYGLRARIPATVLDIFTAATIVGERHVSVRDLADVCEVSTRTLQQRLVEARVTSAKNMLMWMLSLHTIWRMARVGWTVRRAADEAECASPDGLARLVKRVTGVRLACEASDVSFADMLAQCESEILH